MNIRIRRINYTMGFGFRRDFGPREMHKATCAECGKECEVPFKPTEGRPVFCKDCYAKKRRY
jgi:CxxC-x17-CxxC domain-containing protein